MKLSIVATLYQSEKYLNEFLDRSREAARLLVDEDFEIILVNDGSPDSSLELAVQQSEIDEKITVIDLSRNFGHHKAMMTGLIHSQGEQVFLIDSDLEESPEWLTEFSTTLDSAECDVVYGLQAKRKGNKFEQLSGACFYRLFDFLTGLELPKDVVTARLMSRRYVRELVKHLDKEVFIAGLWHITGFKQVGVSVEKQSSSITTYTFRRKLSILVNSVTSFSNAPLKGIFYIGALISTLSVLYIFYLVLVKLFFAGTLSGWTSVMASIWLLGGLIISFLGVIGIYLSKIFSETKDRPYTVIRHIYGKPRN